MPTSPPWRPERGVTDASAGRAGAGEDDRTRYDAGHVKVSVVIPVYNTVAYLSECLDSVLAQDLPPEDFEVVAVDDGSTDGSGSVLDGYGDRHPTVRVIHQENSGWPGRPRNVGLSASRASHVFFADSDDRLAPEALRRMHDFAVAHGSDVVVPKKVPLVGPSPPDYVWRRTQVDADLTRAMLTLGPWKLFRKDFLDERGLRFPEGKVRLEDGIFVTEAYLTARRVSLLADYDYYFKRAQPDRGNISSSPVDPDGYTSSISRMIDTIRRHCTDPSLADALVATLYRRKALKWFGPDRFARYGRDRQEAWVRAVADLADAHVPTRLDDQLPLLHRTRSVLVRHREVRALVGLAVAQQAGRPLKTVLVDTWLEVHVPGLRGSPSCVVAPGLRLVPAAEDTAASGGPRAALRSLARRYARPLAQRSAVGRRGWAWARDRLATSRRG
jgi:poly(ribitol-phosphate) beta-N-acetylglucosaminyltransferase